jgi:threonine/homoserine/homoserine lactone efflux protein
MILPEFLITSLIIVLMPGTGVIYTLSIGLLRGGKAATVAALGCTLGIVPHLVASMLGLAAILHASALAFQVFKWLGVLYLAYLAWTMWQESGVIQLDAKQSEKSYAQIALRAVLINVLNPKLSIFFLAFLPQFIPAGAESPLPHMLVLSAVFMLMTLVVFIGYGLLARQVRFYLANSPLLMRNIQRVFAGLFVALGVKLAAMER